MNRLMLLLLGTVKVRVTGADLNRFLNLCAAQNIGFWGHRRDAPDCMTLFLSAKDFFALPRIARRSMCRVHILSRHGFPFFLKRIRPRWVLIGGAVMFALCAWVMSSFVWEITISGESTVPHNRILAVLEENGVSPGAFAASLNLNQIKNQILIDLPELIYVNINLHGSHADVIVRDRTRPPEIVNERGFANIVAKQGGIIERIIVQEGTPEAKKGDLVVPGQILANGYMTGRNGVTVTTHARADVYARTWDKTQAIFPLTAQQILLSEKTRTRYTLVLGKHRIKIFEKGSITQSECDKIITSSQLTLPGGIPLPILLERETAHECVLQPIEFSLISAVSLVAKEMQSRISLSGSDSLVDCRFSAEERPGAVVVQMTAECIKQIGMEEFHPEGE